MLHSLRILLSELILMSLISTTLLPASLMAAEPTMNDVSITHSTDIDTSQAIPGIPLSDETSLGGSTPVETSSGILDVTSPPTSDISVSTSSTGSDSSVGTSNTRSDSSASTPIEEGMNTIEQGELAREIPPTTDNEDLAVKKTTKTQAAIENEILIEFHSDIDTYVGQYQVDRVTEQYHLTPIDTIAQSNITVMSVSTGSSDITSGLITKIIPTSPDIDSVISTISQDPRVAHVQKNMIYRISSNTTSSIAPKDTIPGTYMPDAFTGRSLPNDTPLFRNLWGLDNQGQVINGISGTVDADIDYPEAMAYASGKLNTSVLVATLDTGVNYTHPDLMDNLWDGSNCISDTGAVLGGCKYGYNFADDNNDPLDRDGHGTHIAGTIGASTNNGTGIVGITPNVKIMAIKIFNDDGYTSTTAIIRGIHFATANGAKVINASFGGIEDPQSIRDFDYLTYHAIAAFPGLFVAAAGNDGLNTDILANKHFPAGYGSDTTVSGEAVIDNEIVLSGSVTIPALTNVISVAASNQQDAIASFSNYGEQSVHIAAPGSNIYSTYFSEGSGQVDAIKLSNGWDRQASISGEYWDTRPNITVSGEAAGVDFSTALWGDTMSPYQSGSNAYIQKTFSGLTNGKYTMRMGVWCDTTSFDADYLEILVSTGGLFQSVGMLNESDVYWKSSALSKTWINGHDGYYGADTLITRGDFGPDTRIRIRWHSDLHDAMNYGCAVRTLSMTPVIASYEYMDGTSMAAPHVAGAAALAWSYQQDASVDRVRSAIIKGGDHLATMSGKTIEGSRLNIAGMLQALEVPTLLSHTVTLSGASGAKISIRVGPENIDAGQHVSISNDLGFVGYIGYTGGTLPSNVQFQDHYIKQSQGSTFEFIGLTPDTTYYYEIAVYGTLSKINTHGQILSFHTPRSVNYSIASPITTSGSVYLSGSTASGVIFSGSTASGHIILTNTVNTVTVDIPTQRLSISASGTWDGMLMPPMTATGSPIINTASGSIPVSTIYSMGSDTSSLSLSGELATIRIASTQPTGTRITVYRSEDHGALYTAIATCTITGGLCIFTTDHFSLFALSNPMISITSVTSPTITGGGGGASSSPSGVNTATYPAIQPTEHIYTISRGSIQKNINPNKKSSSQVAHEKRSLIRSKAKAKVNQSRNK